MDIYKYAESINYLADYYDYHSGLIYGIKEYKDKGLDKIPIYDPSLGNRIIGYATKNLEEEDY